MMFGKQILNTLFFLTCLSLELGAQDIFRFEHYDTKDGLSQNLVSSILCDREGFLWVGTMNGLNRFDGYNFRVFGGETKNAGFTNNRVIRLWQDDIGFIWIETYDHFYHYFNPINEQINTFAAYYKPGSKTIDRSTCFLQYTQDIVWIGNSKSGIYYLKYKPEINDYEKTQISDKGRYAISNNNIRFIISDRDSVVYVGTEKGLNLINPKSIATETFNFQHFFVDYAFNSAISTEDEMWFASDKQGIVVYDKVHSSYRIINQDNTPQLLSNNITGIHTSDRQQILITTKDNGALLYDTQSKTWTNIQLKGKNVDQIYFDRFANAWITTEIFGVNKFNLKTCESRHYQLTDAIQKSITDRERHVFYEDVDSNLWIGLHGGALALYNRTSDTFQKYINDPADKYSIASNIVHSIAEDRSGQMWLGTGHHKGGLEKVIRRNPAFKRIVPTPEITQTVDNVVRCISQDHHENIWLSTKNGYVHIYSPKLEKITHFHQLKTNKTLIENANVYSILIDKQQHIWLGTKGHGIFVSQAPISSPNDYDKLLFYHYADSINKNIYSLEKGRGNDIYIGTYGNGIYKTQAENYANLSFENYNTINSHLSNDLVRKVKLDSDSNLWAATVLGLNVLPAESLKQNKIKFHSYFKEAHNPDQICYNDIIEIYEDSEHQLWFGTFGGGISQLKLPLTPKPNFKTINTQNGLSNNIVFGILEDQQGQIWISSEYGLNRYDKEHQTFQIFNESNGLAFDNFSEGTCFKLKDGRLLFGGFGGVELIFPSQIEQTLQKADDEPTKLTNFQLFNKDVAIGGENSPLQKSISFATAITLQHHQSGFSFEYSALDFFNPSEIQYAYKLEGFETEWNYVGKQTKAAYTNLPQGEYVFRVKHTKRNGNWNENIKELPITILPPWWQTRWAYVGYLLLLIGGILITGKIIYGVNKYRNELSVEKRINELKLRFFTNISHEIRTPLTLILGPLEDIIDEEDISNKVRKQLVLMKKNTKRMLKLVNQLLDFRRIQNNKMSLNISAFELNRFTQDIYENFIPLAKHCGIGFKFEKAPEDIMIWADAVKLDSIIYNLISNALKFTPKGKNVSIKVEKSRVEKQAFVRVNDEGKGIPDENIADIFTRFVILNKNDDRSSGIGLSLAYELARLHSGNIRVESEIGEGSCFCFSIPLEKEIIIRNPNVKITEEQETSPRFGNRTEEIMPYDEHFAPIDKDKATLLIVEDNAAIVTYLKNRLKDEYNCYIANNGKEGLRQAEVQNPDVIITDIMMPEMDGIEMTKKLKENFALCHIPIVIMTAKSDIQDQIEGFDTGAEAYITKPLHSRHLKAVVRSLINQRKLVISKFRDNKTIDPTTLKVNSKDEEFLHQLLLYIENNYTKELSVEHIAGQFCMSRTVLYNKIKGLTGFSPLEFIRQIKLKLSFTLLQKGYSVSETAYEIGYTDVKYFSRQFKKMFGHLPSKVRK